MEKIRERDRGKIEIRIGREPHVEWSKERLASLKEFIKKESEKFSEKERIEIKLTSLRYKMEDYVERRSFETGELKTLDVFVKMFLEALNITFKTFAASIDTSDGNLKKYISGERKFNTDLALKFGSFFHTPADLWLMIYMKNELQQLQNEKVKKKYKKYDYEKLISQ